MVRGLLVVRERLVVHRLQAVRGHLMVYAASSWYAGSEAERQRPEYHHEPAHEDAYHQKPADHQRPADQESIHDQPAYGDERADPKELECHEEPA